MQDILLTLTLPSSVTQRRTVRMEAIREEGVAAAAGVWCNLAMLGSYRHADINQILGVDPVTTVGMTLRSEL